MREILVRDLAKCINCDTCLTACRTRHGRARMTMQGPRFGRYQLPDVCRHCPDTPCMSVCHLGGMQRRDDKTLVSDACRGCNKCVEACRYGVIALLPRQSEARRGFLETIFAQTQVNHQTAPNYRIATDASRCVQCGICGHNCPAGIAVRDYARRGKIMDDARCFGCGLCIEKCPRGTLRFEMHPAAPVSKFRADKCDLCNGYAESNCVKECPTGALLRLKVDDGLARLDPALYDFVIHPRDKLDPAAHSMPIFAPQSAPESLASAAVGE
ncbi:MAG: 4Fe-4S dicluster domain-containing protein [Chloroflexi bacterium]|nr:4Fe-4S dicluster domain-containing protein [Chloroflexota bacterium]